VAELETRPFNLNLLLTLHSILLEQRARTGTKDGDAFAPSRNWIGADATSMDQACSSTRTDTATALLIIGKSTTTADERDPLVQLAVVHAQFENPSIRLSMVTAPGPNTNTLYLYERKVLRQPMFYLSGYLKVSRNDTSSAYARDADPAEMERLD